jgi:hypothetical protein
MLNENCMAHYDSVLSWSKKVWTKAESKWMSRNGQDRVYRDLVAIPGLSASIMRSCDPTSIELIDLGCGDGYTTDKLASEFFACGFIVEGTLLLDRSLNLLDKATNRLCLHTAIKIECEMNKSGWARLLPPRIRKRIIISTFFIQELHSLQHFIKELAQVMIDDDVAFFLTVAPDYSSSLALNGAIRELEVKSGKEDWLWRGLYPIDSPEGIFYLPHFERSISDYVSAFQCNGLEVVDISYLSVPNTRSANELFVNTIYGADIIGKPSSVVITIKRATPC